MLQVWMSISPREAPAPPPPAGCAPRPIEPILDRILGSRRLRVAAAPAACAARASSERDGIYALRIGRPAPPPALPEDDEEPTLLVDEARGRLRCFVPFSATGQLFLSRRGETLLLANDPRLLVPPASTLDPQAVLCLLEFGALVPPLTLWREVRRLEPSCWTEIELASLACRTQCVDPWGPPRPELRDLAAEAADDLVAERLDEILRARGPDDRAPVILFSGGVDSGLLAARARELGWTGTLLANYSMGPEDPEAALAARMARHLGLPLTTLANDFDAWGGPIARLAELYPQPLGDYSMIPTQLLCAHVSAQRGGRALLWDGSGADGVFGAFRKLPRWERLYRAPLLARRLAGGIFAAGGLWQGDGRLARRLAAARISAGMPYLLGSMIAENPLRGIAYEADPRDVRALHETISCGVEGLATLPEPESPSRILDLRHVVCDFTAQKDAPLGLGGELDIAYPFLEPALLRLGVRAAVSWPGQEEESKAVLKRLLARAVPREMVYRPKSGFMPPIAEAFRHGPVRDALAESLAAHGPLSPWLRPRALASLERRARSHRLSHRAYNFLWTLLATDHWLRQFAAAHALEEPRAERRASGGHDG